MNSLVLMAATCLMGQVAPPDSTSFNGAPSEIDSTIVQGPDAKAAPVAPVPAPGDGSTSPAPACSSCVAAPPCGCCDRVGLLKRLRARLGCCFHHDDCTCGRKPLFPCLAKAACPCAPKSACCATQVACPSSVNPTCPTCGTPVQMVSESPAQPGVIQSRYVNRIGHEPDYSSVTGQLSYLHVDGGIWVVRYASVETEDRFGGSVVLASSASMHNFREGDLVTVHGEILNDGRASRYLGGPLYRASAVDMVDRAD